MEGKLIITKKEYTKQVMHTTIDHHMLTIAQPVPEQWAISFVVHHDPLQHRLSLWPVWINCSGCVPSQLLVHSHPPCWLGRRRN